VAIRLKQFVVEIFNLNTGHITLVNLEVIRFRVRTRNGFRDIQWQMWCNGWHDFKQPLCKGQGYSFWYQSIPHIQLPIGCQ